MNITEDMPFDYWGRCNDCEGHGVGPDGACQICAAEHH